MKILVTGYSGFVGRKLLQKIKKQYEIVLLGRKKIKKRKFIIFNFNSLSELKKILNKNQPDVIINLAAVANFKKKLKIMKLINEQVPKIFAEYCKKNKAYLLHISGTLVHGDKKNYSKFSKYKPNNYYAKTKLNGDKYIIKSKCKYSILRLPGIFGFNGPNHLGLNNFIMNKLAKKKINFTGNLKSKRNYIFVEDVVKIILKHIKFKTKGIHYIAGETLTFKETLKIIEKIIIPKIKVKIIKSKQKIGHQIVLPSQKNTFTSFSKSLKIIKNEYRFSLRHPRQL